MTGWDSTGAGPALVLLHAFPFDRRMWEPSLFVGHRVVRVDLYGPSSVDDMADRVATALDEAGIATATLLGLSMGGYVALALAARRPARVGALVLCDTRADGEADRAARDAARAELVSRRSSFLDELLPKLFAPLTPAEPRERMRRLADEQSTEDLDRALVALRDRPDRKALLPSLRVPTLVVVGAADVVTPLPRARELQEAIPGAELRVLPGCGHLTSVEDPTAFARVVLDFTATL